MARNHVLAPLVLAVLASAAITACSTGGDRPSGDRRGDGGIAQGQASPGRGAGDSYTRAARLVDAGEYATALPALRCLADQGRGYEIAQFLAGHSALMLSGAADTPEILRGELRVEGFDRLILAANAGWPSAQAELARWFASTPGEQARQQAAYWAAVYRANRRDLAYGLDRLDDELEADIRRSAGEETARAAEIEAGAFTLDFMPTLETGPECARFVRRAGAQGEFRRAPGSQNRDGRGRGGAGRRPGGDLNPAL